MLILLKRGRRGRGAQVRACLPACAPWTLARASGVVAKPSVARFRFRCEALENAIESLFSPRATRRGPRRPITAEFATLCRRFRPPDPWGRRTRPKLHPTRSPRSKKTRASRSPSSASGRADAVISERLVRRARPRARTGGAPHGSQRPPAASASYRFLAVSGHLARRASGSAAQPCASARWSVFSRDLESCRLKGAEAAFRRSRKAATGPSTLFPRRRAQARNSARASKRAESKRNKEKSKKKRLGPTSVDDALVVLGVGLCGVLGLAEVDGRGSLELAAGVVREDARPERADRRLEEFLCSRARVVSVIREEGVFVYSRSHGGRWW